MELTYAQKRQLIEEGYVVVKGAVSQLMVERAMKAINHSIGRGSGAEGANWCRELESDSVITEIYNKTPVKQIVDSLVGEDAYWPIGSAQIALRFPEYWDDPPKDAGAHLDGVLALKDGVMQNFTALVGVVLSDQSARHRGNFTVYPGTHKAYEAYFREHGADIMLREEAFQTMHRSPNVPLPDPVQIVGEPGDLIITHFQLIHAGGVNSSDRIRYSLYYRIDHKERHRDWKAPLTDLWRHWPGLHGFVQSEGNEGGNSLHG